MLNYSELYDWLQNDITKPAVIRNGDTVDTIIRVPRDDDFEFLYYQRNYNGGGLLTSRGMSFCGIYSRLDGQLYDTRNPLKGILTDIDSGKSLMDIEEEFVGSVCKYIENVVDNDITHLRSPFFEDDSYNERLEDFIQDAEFISRKMFLEGDSTDELKYQCDYVLDRKNDDLMFRYLQYPSATVEEAATQYWQTHQDDILLELRKNEIIREKYRAVEAQKNNPLHKQRAIMAAVKESGAKTVNVTIIKGGEEYSFKYNADNLCRYANKSYDTWDMSSKDKQGFEERFGRWSSFSTEDITSISYRGKTLYDAGTFLPDETEDLEIENDESEDDDEEFTMSM